MYTRVLITFQPMFTAAHWGNLEEKEISICEQNFVCTHTF